MKAREKERLAALRLAWNAIRNVEIDTRTELDDPTVIKLLASEIKKRKESAAAYRDGGRDELAATEDFEATVMAEFLPQAPSEDRVR